MIIEGLPNDKISLKNWLFILHSTKHQQLETMQTSNLRAFFTNSLRQSQYVLVTMDHYVINGFVSVPRLDDEFLNITSYVRTWKYHFIGTGDKYVIYYHDPSPHVGNMPMEMIMLKYKKIGAPKRLVNLQASDDWFVNHCIQRYVFNFNYKHSTLTCTQVFTTTELLTVLNQSFRIMMAHL